MKRDWGIIIFGLAEIFIGAITLCAVTTSFILGSSVKPPGVLVFVLVTAFLSLILGIGILKLNLTCYHLLLFLATVIIFSKIMIFSGIIQLSGALETTIPSGLKNIISIIYHGLLIYYFSRRGVRIKFGERREVLFSLKIPFSGR